MPTDTQPSAGTLEAGQRSIHGTIDVTMPVTPDRVFAMWSARLAIRETRLPRTQHLLRLRASARRPLPMASR
jgi:hypothetical protein